MKNEYFNDEGNEEVEATVEDVEKELLASGAKYKIVKSGGYVEIYAAIDLMSDEEKEEFYEIMNKIQNDTEDE